VRRKKALVSVRKRAEKRIEWTGAGGDYFLAVVVDREDEIVAEFWGTRRDLVAWIETQWPRIPTKYVPMVYGPTRSSPNSSEQPALRSKKHHAGS